jgi:hypothetical protein
MVALGWMNLLWMGLFAGIIFGEKMWSKGIWVARAVGVGLVIIGILVISGMLPSLVTSAPSSTNDNSGMGMLNDGQNLGDGKGDRSMTNDSKGEMTMGMHDTDNIR